MPIITGMSHTDLAQGLRRLADRIEAGEFAEVEVRGTREPRELDPLRGECPMDGFRHLAPGLREVWEITLHHHTNVDKT